VETRESLILRLNSLDDADAWQQFVSLYEPILKRFAARCGLQPADRDEVVQNVMTSVAKSVVNWTPNSEQGQFRTWLFRIARNRVIDFLRSRRPDRATGRTSAISRLHQIEEPGSESDEWLADHRREVFRQIAAIVREQVEPEKWDVFWSTTVLEQPAAEVAARHQISKNTLYIIKCRIIKRMRELYDKIEGKNGL
jgi:RNA polymerase sigma-70 factor, ECF subfamily